MNSELTGVSRVGPDGCPSQKERRRSSKNLCSVPEVTTAKQLHVRLMREKDWFYFMIGWWVLQRLKLDGI